MLAATLVLILVPGGCTGAEEAGAHSCTASEAFAAAGRIGRVEARDPSLPTAQRYLTAMLTEYGEGMKLRAKGEDAGKRLYRAFGLANFAHDVLVQAQPEPAKRGCDVSVLL